MYTTPGWSQQDPEVIPLQPRAPLTRGIRVRADGEEKRLGDVVPLRLNLERVGLA